MDLPQVLAVLLFLLAVGLLSYAAWVSLQSLLQARLLLRARNGPRSGIEEGARAALNGPVTILSPIAGHGLRSLIYYKCVTQRYRSSGKSSHWTTVDTDEQVAAFSIRGPAGEVRVTEPPTEIQGCESITFHDDPGFLGLFHTSGDRRRVVTQLDVPHALTVLGRLQRSSDGWRLTRDNKVGLLFSPHTVEGAAAREIAKGLLGLLLVTAAVAAGLYLYLQQKR